jgi:hypothetical protein
MFRVIKVIGGDDFDFICANHKSIIQSDPLSISDFLRAVL